MFIKTKRINLLKILRMIIITLTLWCLLMLVVKNSAAGWAPDSYREITICRGDTLWGIAKEYKPGKNTGMVIYEIMKFNNLEKSGIFPGQNLKIPLNN